MPPPSTGCFAWKPRPLLRACRRLWRSAALALLLASCLKVSETVPKREVAKPEEVHLLLVATHDWHGQLFATKTPTAQAGMRGVLPQGGALAFFAQLSALREAFPKRVLWVDAGGLLHEAWTADPRRRRVLADAFSLMELDFAAVGGQDFEFPAGLLQEGGEAQGALKSCMLRAKFPWSSANIYSMADGTRPAWLGGDSLRMVERQGVHIGFIGLTTPRVPLHTAAANTEGLFFGDMALAAQEKALALREMGADVVVLVAHASATACARGGMSSCEAAHSEVGALLEALPEGLVDAVVAGHTHTPRAYFFKGVPVVQSGGLGKHFSLIELYWEPTQRRLLREKTRLQAAVPICEKTWPSRQNCEGPPPPGEEAVSAPFFGKALMADAELMALLMPEAKQFYEEVHALLGVEVAKRLSLEEGDESELGGLWAESLQQAMQADIALLSREVFHEALPAGTVSVGRLFRSMPQDSRVAVVHLPGEALRRLMQLAFGQTRFRFDVAGVELRIGCLPSGRRQVQTQLVSADGQRRPVEDEAFYWVAMPEFLAEGGAGLQGMVAEAPPRQTKLGGSMREEVLHFWLQQAKPLSPPLRPRVLWENALESCESLDTPLPPSKEQP